jgi:hypothetical protein
MHFLSIISVFFISMTQSSDIEHLLTEQGSFDIANIEFMKYGKFVLGAVVGASVEGTGNIRNECLADVASIITSGYHIYYYGADYMETNEELALAWAITYMVKGFETWFNIDCVVIAEFTQGLTANMTDSFGPSNEVEASKPSRVSRPNVKNHDENYNNGEMPDDQELPWYDDGSSNEN